MATVSILTPESAGAVGKIASTQVPQTTLRSLKGKADDAVVRTLEDLDRRVRESHQATITVAQAVSTAVAPAPAPAVASPGGAMSQALASSLTAAAGAAGATGPAGPPGPPGPPGASGFEDWDADDDWLLSPMSTA